jgi:adenylate kinase family enzyme
MLRGYVPMVRRIHIIGSTGSGKSYIANLLSRRLNLPVFDLDDLFWDRAAATYGVRTAGGVRDRKLAQIAASDAWIIEGVYHQWVGPSFDRAELILMLVPSVWVRDVRVVRRFIKRKLGLVPSKRESLMAFIRERNRAAVKCRSLQEVLRAVGDGT